MKCLVLAGGFATRLRPSGINRPKALLEYKGELLLSHIVNKVPKSIDILVTINTKSEADFQEWQRTVNRKLEICVEPSLSNEKKLGAVSALNFWIGHRNISEDLLVICGDNYFDFDIQQFIASYDGTSILIGVCEIGDKSKARQFGVVELQDDKIIELQEKPAMPKSSLIATGIYIFPSRIFPYLSQYCSHEKRDQLGEFISYLLDIDEVRAYTFTELWFDIGSAEAYDQVSGGQPKDLDRMREGGYLQDAI